MKLKYLNQIESATDTGRSELFRLGIAVIFLVGIMIVTSTVIPNNIHGVLLVAAAAIGGYMALNIGANDVANNVGPAVGSKALTIFWAIIIAVIFESAGAIIAGGDVVSTVKKGIIDPELIDNTDEFIWLMMAALLAASIWLNVATISGTPVSTTHAIVGGVLGAGIAAGGTGVANWPQLGSIALSWVISPGMGGLIAAGTLFLIKRTVTYKSDKIAAAKLMIPILVAIMGWAFGTYIVLKGLKKVIKLDFGSAALIGIAVALIAFLIAWSMVKKRSATLENDNHGISELFTIPLICSAALLSFAHGANDVANAVGPLAAINSAIFQDEVVSTADIPFWVLAIGATGIALGLTLYGPKLIRVVGSEITELNQMRAFCVALAAAVTVIIASQLGLPVSSTHVAVGAVFGVGFLRESIKANYATIIEEIRDHHTQQGHPEEQIDEFLNEFEQASFEEKGLILKKLKSQLQQIGISKTERKRMNKHHRQQLVKRSALFRIVAAWIITVPVSALLAAMFFFMLRGMLM